MVYEVADGRPGIAAAPGGEESGGKYSVQLTERERQVLSALANGLSQKEVALALGISPMTVRVHVVSCCSKLRARNSLHAVVLARKHGSIDF